MFSRFIEISVLMCSLSVMHANAQLVQTTDYKEWRQLAVKLNPGPDLNVNDSPDMLYFMVARANDCPPQTGGPVCDEGPFDELLDYKDLFFDPDRIAIAMGERFAGQTLTNDAGIDRLSGPPSLPMQVLAGAPGEHLWADNFNLSLPDIRVLGIGGDIGGAPGNPNPEGYGSMAVWFQNDLPGIFFEMFFENNTAPMLLEFYARDGSVIDTVTLTRNDLGGGNSVGFANAQGEYVIAGFTLEHAGTRTDFRVGLAEMFVPGRVLFANTDGGDDVFFDRFELSEAPPGCRRQGSAPCLP